MLRIPLLLILLIGLSGCLNANPDAIYIANERESERKNAYLANEQRKTGNDNSASILESQAAQNRRNIENEYRCDFFDVVLSLIFQASSCK